MQYLIHLCQKEYSATCTYNMVSNLELTWCYLAFMYDQIYGSHVDFIYSFCAGTFNVYLIMWLFEKTLVTFTSVA